MFIELTERHMPLKSLEGSSIIEIQVLEQCFLLGV